ncbi:WD40-repeat-containing domain protein [Xylogone sp. PMI_703]|nr:WD40-repeat-containing domain protein [Xylogone sp. PMI_703]
MPSKLRSLFSKRSNIHGDPKRNTNLGAASSTSQSIATSQACSADLSIPILLANANVTSLQDIAEPATSNLHRPSTAQLASTTVITDVSKRLWNTAYDQLKQQEPKLVKEYEKILSQKLENGDLKGPQLHENSIEQVDINKRWSQMEQLARASLKKTERENEVKQVVNAALRGVTSLNALIETALQAIPQAALAWTGVCFAIQVLVNSTAETKTNREGIMYVISRMKWHYELSVPLLADNAVDVMFAKLRDLLEQSVVNLYQALLLYLIKSVCSCYRNRIIATIRDAIQLDDWNESLQNIKDAENIAEKDRDTYLAHQNNYTHKQQLLYAMHQRDNQCIQDLRVTDPSADKTRIESSKGGLLEDSYHWILENPDFKHWHDDQQSRLLWIKGDPGKGKTMLLCGIINKLKKSKTEMDLLAYFFCQATDDNINKATAVLRGLIYLLVDQQPSLILRVRDKYDKAGKSLFEDANAWDTLCEIFTNILQDLSLNNTWLIIDALDECTTDLSKLLEFVVRNSSLTSRVKWIISSRNDYDIGEQLKKLGQKIQLCLELNSDSISTAVTNYIKKRVSDLSQQKEYDDKTKDLVLDYLSANSNDTFLWVALVCDMLKEKSTPWNTLKMLKTFPPGLDSLYGRMIAQIYNSDDPDFYMQVLALMASVYRPISSKELTSLVEVPGDNCNYIKGIISHCGSFLTIQDDIIYFIHQSAKDYLLSKASDQIFPSGIKEAHHVIFFRSIQVMSKMLKRDIYNLRACGYPIEQVEKPSSDPLATLRYSCVYWAAHFCDCNSDSNANHEVSLQDEDVINTFIRGSYLCWLEALSLCRSVSRGVFSMARLEALFIQRKAETVQLLELVQDARRFITYHGYAIENYPLQAYASTLLFSPTGSLIRKIYDAEGPKNIAIKPAVRDKWSSCLQTFEGHKRAVTSVAFLDNSTRLVSASFDGTVKIWDANSGKCLRSLEDHRNIVTPVMSHDSTRCASFSRDDEDGDYIIKIWDISSGKILQTLRGHSRPVSSVVFSHDLARLASASWDCTVKIWDIESGTCLHTLSHENDVNSVIVSYDFTRLASTSGDGEIMIWDMNNGKCLQMLESRYIGVIFSHDSALLASSTLDDDMVEIWDTSNVKCLQTLEDPFEAAVFSHGSTRLISASITDLDNIKIWDISSGTCLQTLQGRGSRVNSLVLSHDLSLLVSASCDGTIEIWNVDTSSDKCLRTFEGHGERVNSVIFSHDLTRLASASDDGTIKIWDGDINSKEYLQTSERHYGKVESMVFSHDFTRLASLASYDMTVKIWDTSSGNCLRTLKGHTSWVNSVLYSHNSTRLASASVDYTVKIWDVSSGDCLQTLKGHESWVGPITFSHNSTQLASGSDDETVKIWEISSGKCLQTFRHGSRVKFVLFSHDSTRLVSVSDDCILIWDINSNKDPQILGRRTGGFDDRINFAVFSHDSTRLASSSDHSTSSDHDVKIWDTSSGECLHTLVGHNNRVISVVFTHDSTRLASTSYKTVKIWDASSSACLQTYLIGQTLSQISFDITGSYLRTEAGIIAINLSSNATESVMDYRFPGWGLSSDNTWITYNSKNVVWLPSEYRPSCSAVLNMSNPAVSNLIGFGVGSGKVWICSLKAKD